MNHLTATLASTTSFTGGLPCARAGCRRHSLADLGPWRPAIVRSAPPVSGPLGRASLAASFPPLLPRAPDLVVRDRPTTGPDLPQPLDEAARTARALFLLDGQDHEPGNDCAFVLALEDLVE